MTFREEVLNTYLAYLLEERNLVSLPESVICRGYSVREMPDVLVRVSGLRLVIEAKKEAAGAEKALREKALARLRSGLAHAVLLVLYPEEFFREGGPGAILERLERDRFRAALILSTEDLSSPRWFETDLEGLSARLRRLRETVLSEDLINEAVEIIRGLIGRYQLALSGAPGVESRLAEALGLSLAAEGEDRKSRRILADIAKIAPLVLVSAMVFQEVLSRTEKRVPSILEFEREGEPVLAALSVWEMITREINYAPIFRLSAEVLRISSGVPDFPDVFKDFVEGAYRIAARPAALRHDLMGRLFHLFLSEAKYLGAFYTRLPAAELLLKLAVGLLPHPPETFLDPENLRNFRVADLACGTGTLLVAAAEALFDRHLLASAAKRVPSHPSAFFKALFEDSLWGYDVVPTALHLTAASLALLAPEVTFRKMNLFCMPLGPDQDGTLRLGSLEFLRGSLAGIQRDLFAARSIRQVEDKPSDKVYADLPSLDLCTMNPPFTRSNYNNLLFGGFPRETQRRMQKSLSKLIKREKLPASSTAGLGAVFIALADRYLKPEGLLALVLPKVVLSGPAWEKTRNLFGEKYVLRFVVSSHDPSAWNFSENTDLSEVLIVAQKGHSEEWPAVFVSLWRNPASPIQAFSVAERLLEVLPELPNDRLHVERFFENGDCLGALISIPVRELEAKSWSLWAGFAQPELAIAAHAFRQGRIWWPGGREVFFKKIILGEMARLGPDLRDLHDGYRLVEVPTDYPAFWNHETGKVISPIQEPNAWLYPLPRAKPGRPLRRAEDLWRLAGRLLLAERLWLNTARATAIRLPQPVLGNVWWEISGISEEEEWLYLLWFNSSGGLLSLLSIRTETQGSWVNFKKPVMTQLVVPQTDEVLTNLDKIRTRLSSLEFRPFPKMSEDPARAEVDRLAAEVFGIPEEWFAWLRETLPREPVISLKPLI